jgi:CheY-like chemotaxis protein
MSPHEHAHPTILVIDDNFDAAEMLTSLLRALGFTADFRTDGWNGIQAAKQMVPDVILLDIGMPVMDGYETVRRLRVAPELCRCKLVALTAWSDSETRAKTKDSGFHLHVTKPASIVSLMNALDIKPA